jgi:ATP-dependent Clp protease protease subunit
LTELQASDTGQTLERITHDINRDFWMTADDALSYGIIDTGVGHQRAT